MAKKSCKKGYYYCYSSKKCKRIPMGYYIGGGGWLRKEEEKSEDTETKKNGNGNGANGNGNGNGGSNGGSNGGGVSEAWSAKYKKSIDCDNPKGFSQRAHCRGRKKVNEATMSPAQKRKDTMLKKKYDKSDMKQNMIDQYGKEEGTKIYFATIRKQAMKEESNPRVPRKKGQPANSKKHSDLYTDENPKGTIHGLGFKDVATAKASVAKIKKSSRSHAHKIQAAIAMEQRARVMGKTSEAAVFRKFINSMKKKTKQMNEAKSGDHEVAMAQSQLKKSAENIAKLRKALGKKEKDIPAWMQAKITDTAHDTDAAAGYVDKMDEQIITEKRDGKSSKDKGYSLRDWFKGGGWKQTGGKYDGKPCAKQPGQKTKPYCRDADDRAAMSKEERNKRARKKRREDPNPNRKGKAKNVTQESYSSWRTELDEGILDFLNPKNQENVRQGSYHKDPKVKKGTIFSNVSKRNEMLKRLQNQSFEPEGELVDEGKKDACYHKVKSRYSVWPSAYASGALVKCRKVGAANWGNKTKKEGYELGEMASEKEVNKKLQKKIKSKDLNPTEYIKNANMMPGSGITKKLADDYQYSNWKDDFQPTEYETVDIIKPEPLQPSQSVIDEAGKKCWKGYKKAGTQKLFGKTYNRCVKAHFSDWRADMDLQEKKAKKDYDGDGKVETGEEEYKGSRDKAIKKAIAMKEDWQKSNRKDGVDGMSQKSVDAYKRENPGSKLQTAVTGKVKKGSKDAKRRKSFCSRSKGQKDMHNIDCTKTPEKKICKARKRWRC